MMSQLFNRQALRTEGAFAYRVVRIAFDTYDLIIFNMQEYSAPTPTRKTDRFYYFLF
jgi:hypothetical protein